MVSKFVSLIFVAGVAAFAAYVGVFLLTVFQLHPAWMSMLLTSAVLFTLVVGVMSFAEVSTTGKKRLFGAALVVVLIAGGGTVGWEWYISDLEMAEGRGIDLYTYEPFNNKGTLARLSEEASFQMEEPLRLDGATALYPVYAAFVEAVYPEGDYDPHGQPGSKVVSTQTDEAYHRLVTNQTDIIFAAGPSEEQQRMAKEYGVEFKQTPLGKEAFVFFTHADNNVDGLTVEEVQQIYGGEVTNWEKVGGNDAEIRAFQRPEGSGSQTALIKLMEGKPLMEPPHENIQQGMGGMIKETSDYRNHRMALGYSFRFYTQEMANSGDIDLLELNGVPPEKETIRDGTYPVTDHFYAVTRKSDHDEAEEEFIDWILSEEGQYLIEESGYIPVKEQEREG